MKLELGNKPEISNGIGMEREAFLFTGATSLLRLLKMRTVVKSLTCDLRAPSRMTSLHRVRWMCALLGWRDPSQVLLRTSFPV